MMPVREWMRDKRVAAVLVVVAIAFVGYRWIGPGKGSAPAVPGTSVAISPPVGVQESTPPPFVPAPPVPVSAPIPAGWTGPAWSWNRNPFLTQAGHTARNGNGEAALPAGGEGIALELRGTVVSGAAAMAIFRSHGPDGGGRLVPVGGNIGEWTLFRVEPYRVSLRRGKETRVLELYRQ